MKPTVALDLIGAPVGLSALNSEFESLLGDAHGQWNWFVDSSRATAGLPRDVHVLTPGNRCGYKSVALKLDSTPDAILHRVHYPGPKVVFLPVIHGKAPVWKGTSRITGDVVVAYDRSLIGQLRKERVSGAVLSLRDNLFNQACFTLNTVPVSWRFRAKPRSEGKSLQAIRHK